MRLDKKLKFVDLTASGCRIPCTHPGTSG